MVNENDMGPFVLVSFCVYSFHLAENFFFFFWVYFFACLLIGGFGFSYLLMGLGLLYYCQMGCLFGCIHFFVLPWSPLFCCA